MCLCSAFFPHRAPEIILGLPFNQAIDVWSLGNMLVTMLTGTDLFHNQTEFQNVSTIMFF
ncbi:hypothetical protein NQD34_001050 [Periophthalmus magnuspinnatus]|nr:hypothetical protein NQD34_001050 [Periophthalmus magnuspinnatus]